MTTLARVRRVGTYPSDSGEMMHANHLFDLYAPGAVEELLKFHRSVFGDARMEADDDTDGSDDAGIGDSNDRDRDRDRERDDDRDRDGLNEGGKRAIEAERKAAREAAKSARDERKAREAAEARVAELERERMSAQERAEAERDDWRKKYEEQAAQLAARDLDILRRDVAAEKGLTPRQAARLRGETREELESDADDLIREFGVRSPDPDGGTVEDKPRTPRPDRSAGATTGGTVKSVSQTQAAYLAMRSGGSAGGANT